MNSTVLISLPKRPGQGLPVANLFAYERGSDYDIGGSAQSQINNLTQEFTKTPNRKTWGFLFSHQEIMDLLEIKEEKLRKEINEKNYVLCPRMFKQLVDNKFARAHNRQQQLVKLNTLVNNRQQSVYRERDPACT